MLTPIDIDNKTFKKAKIGGYDINDVEDFLVRVMEDYEVLYKENAELKDKASAMQESVSYYKSLEEGVNMSIENAHTEANKVKLEAEQQAELIKKEAELNAKQNIEELKIEILKREAELEEKKKQFQIYKIKVSSMLEAQLKILNDEEEME